MSTETPQTGPELSPLQKALRDIVDPFKSLANSPRALWGLYVSYVLEGLVYFGILTILGKYLSENVGLADLHAGWVYSFFTGGITLAMLFLGGVADKIGVRRALLLSLGMMVLGRVLIASSGTFFDQGLGAGSPMFFAVILGLFIVVLGYGTYQPASYAAVKRFTTEKTASMGYAMIYGLMNLGAFFSGIISPPIRKAMGIESVFWVYGGVCVLAFLVVLFVMTRKVVERDTVIRATPSDKKDEKVVAPAPLWTPAFIVLVLASLASVGFLMRSVITAPPGPGQQATMEARRILRGGGDKVGAAKTGEQRKAALDASLTRLSEQAARVEMPVDLPEGWSTEEALFDLVRARLQDSAEALSTIESETLGMKFPAGGESPAMAMRQELRTLGLFNMAVAYAMVSPVDRGVIENLRRRMKTPEESILPLEESTATRILAAIERGIVPMLTELRNATRAVAGAGSEPLQALFGPLLAVETRFLDRILASASEGKLPERVALLAKERLLQNAVLLLRGLPAILEKGEKKVGDGKDAQAVFGSADVLTSWLKDEAAFTETLRSALGPAVTKPQGRQILDWVLQYGVWLLAVLVFLILAGASMLLKRPQHPFRDVRFVFFIFILIPVQTLFAHNWLTLPYYIDRAFGGTRLGDNFEFFSNINPILIFFLAPMVAALTARAQVYKMMIIGTLVMAAPTFLLTLPPAPFFLLTYILLMSIGEAMWQPRFLQWVAEIAPEGQVGSYMGIGQFPWFLTKVLTGLYSGAFLAAYCPVVGPQDTQSMWLIYSLIAMISPVGLILARNWMLKGTKSVR